MKKSLLIALTAILVAGSASAKDASFDSVDAGTYKLDKTHAFMTFSVSHDGLSDYVVNLMGVDASLQFDPVSVENSSISISVDPTKLNTYYPDAEKKKEWEDELVNDPKFFNASVFPKITFNSNQVKKTGTYTGKVTGDVTFLGVTQPMTFDVTYNGVVNVPWMGDKDIIGFDAIGVMSRSAYGLTALKDGIGDDVTIRFSGEFVHSAK